MTEWIKILWDFQVQTDKLVIANQPDAVVEKHQRTAAVVDVIIPERLQCQNTGT